jgi:hypothetical protein
MQKLCKYLRVSRQLQGQPEDGGLGSTSAAEDSAAMSRTLEFSQFLRNHGSFAKGNKRDAAELGAKHSTKTGEGPRRSGWDLKAPPATRMQESEKHLTTLQSTPNAHFLLSRASPHGMTATPARLCLERARLPQELKLDAFEV